MTDTSKSVRVAAVQFAVTEDVAANLATCLRMIDRAAQHRPEVMVFLAQGTPPYALVAGSASARRATVPMPALVDALRRDRGAEWQPAPAYLSTATVLAGDAALVAPPEPRDWKAWLLWGVLLLGAGLVAAFAFSLLRGRPPA